MYHLSCAQMHQRDPFGDEHNGAWFLLAKGSGVWYQVGECSVFSGWWIGFRAT